MPGRHAVIASHDTTLWRPWLGRWQDLCEVYARYQKGEVTQEQGAEEIQARVAAAALAEDNGKVLPEGRSKKPADETACSRQLSQAERGELTANAAVRTPIPGWGGGPVTRGSPRNNQGTRARREPPVKFKNF